MNPLFSRLRTQASPAPVRRLARLLDQADAVVVGAVSYTHLTLPTTERV